MATGKPGPLTLTESCDQRRTIRTICALDDVRRLKNLGAHDQTHMHRVSTRNIASCRLRSWFKSRIPLPPGSTDLDRRLLCPCRILDTRVACPIQRTQPFYQHVVRSCETRTNSYVDWPVQVRPQKLIPRDGMEWDCMQETMTTVSQVCSLLWLRAPDTHAKKRCT